MECVFWVWTMAYQQLKTIEYNEHGKAEEVYQERFHDKDAIVLDFKIGAFPAFFVETREIRSIMVQIHKLDKQLIRLCDDLPPDAIQQFSRKCMIDEIQITNDIEGVRSTRREIGDAITGSRSMRFTGIVNKYLLLLLKKEIRLETCEDIRKLYDELVLEEVIAAEPKNKPDGIIFRNGPVSVSSPLQQTIHQGLFPEDRIIDAMDRALRFLNDDSTELLYRIAIFHYLLGYIHPFYDGNGRLNRFISSYMLTKEFEPVYSYRISYSIKENQSKYNRAFKDGNDPRNFGELTSFVYTFLQILLESMQNLIGALQSRDEKWKHYSGLIARLPNGSLQKYFFLYSALIRFELFSESGATIKDLKGNAGVSDPTVRKMLGKLTDWGLLKENHSRREYTYGIRLTKIDEMFLNETTE